MDLEDMNIDEDIEVDDGASNKSIISEEREGVSKASDVWKYFTKDVNYKQNKKAKCNVCGVTYICTGGSTSNLNKHIKNKHSGSEKLQEMSIKDILKAVPKWRYDNNEIKLSLQNKIMGITTDNAANNLTFIDALAKDNSFFQKENHFRCFAHVINLCVQDILKELDDRFLSWLRTLLGKIHHSPQRQEKLSFNCELHEISNLKVVLDMSTRWNSTFDMINRALYLKEALNSLALSEKDLKNFVIMDDEWTELEKVKLFLEKFKEITVLMSGSSYPTLSMLIPLYNALIDHMEDYMFEDEDVNENEDENEGDDENGSVDEESIIKKAATNGREKLLQYYNKTNDACVIVTILDPRLKMEYYNDETWNDDQRKEIHEKFLNVYNSTYSNPNSSSTLSNSLNNEYKNSITSKVFKRKRTQEIDEFQVYLLSPVWDESVDPLQWWKDRCRNFN
ncbi:unnamed protein product [Rhizophagus irregularis]|nr:unnamed protein product [Rhizophagus irregularis]